jgi:hypothetical protein
VEVGGSKLEAGQGKSRRPYLKNQTKRQRTGDIAQGVEHLPSKCNAPSLIPSSTERERQREREKTKKKRKGGRQGGSQAEGRKQNNPKSYRRINIRQGVFKDDK